MKRQLLDFLKRCTISPSNSAHFDFLDGLRGMAILFVVVLCHGFYLRSTETLPAKIIGNMLTAGEMGVPIFFVLSGFVIALPFLKLRKQAPQAWQVPGYITRRLAKILPPFAVSVGAFSLYYYLRDGNFVLASEGWKWLLGIPSFASFPYQFNPVYWSLIAEIQFYCVLPCLFWATRGFSLKQTTVSIFLVLLLVPLVARLAVWWHTGQAVAITTARFPFSLDLFAWGVLFAGYYAGQNHTPDRKRALARLGYFGVGGLLLYFGVFALIHISPFFTQREVLRNEIKHLFPAVASFLALFFVFNPAESGNRLLCAPGLKFAGVVSYEWYLFHLPIGNAIRHLVGSTGGNGLLYLVKTLFPMVLTLVLAALIYRFFSLPILRFGRARSSAPGCVSGVTGAVAASQVASQRLKES